MIFEGQSGPQLASAACEKELKDLEQVLLNERRSKSNLELAMAKKETAALEREQSAREAEQAVRRELEAMRSDSHRLRAWVVSEISRVLRLSEIPGNFSKFGY